MKRSRRQIMWLVPLALCCCIASTLADPLPGGFQSSVPGYTPSVPVSALARPLALIDPSRFHVSTSISVGTGFGGGSDALQVTSLSYRFRAPLWMSVSLGNSWGASTVAGGRSSSFFLEGMDLAYRPFSSLSVQVHYRDLRSPLQLSSPFAGYGGWTP